MDKGFVYFNDSKIPFVIENYRMELFTDEPILNDFCKEYNFKDNFILLGQCFDNGGSGRNATFLVENSMGSTCYLRCYIINMFDREEITIPSVCNHHSLMMCLGISTIT